MSLESQMPYGVTVDPIEMIKTYWPHIHLYDKQREIIYSVEDNDETIVRAANQLGKDYIAGLIILTFFLSRHPCKVVSTSVDETQLQGVLWGEIRRFIQSSAVALRAEEGGPLIVNHLEIKKVINGQRAENSYIIGRVAKAGGEGMLGHHCYPDVDDGIPHSLFVGDECSGIPPQYFEARATWAKRSLMFGNPFPCANYFKTAKEIKSEDGKRYYTKIIQIRATDSPNVRFALAQQKKGLKPTGEVLIPGLKTWEDYVKHRKVWDKIKQCICLDAEFYEGAEVLMFPPDWLNNAENQARVFGMRHRRKPKTMGVDPAEGGDYTVWTFADELGIIAQHRLKTPDTTVVVSQTIVFINETEIDPEDVLFDQGGGGKEHADRLRSMGYNVRTIAFGGKPTSPDELKRNRAYRPMSLKVDEQETKQHFKNRRAEMYWNLRQMIDPANGTQAFGIPAELTELRRQLSPMPTVLGPEGEICMLSKNKKSANSKEQTLKDLLGCSPDEADSAVLAAFGLVFKPRAVYVGGVDPGDNLSDNVPGYDTGDNDVLFPEVPDYMW